MLIEQKKLHEWYSKRIPDRFHQLSRPIFLLINVFCTSWGHEIVLSVLSIKTKTISSLQLVQNT